MEFEPQFQQALQGDELFQESLKLVKGISEGALWLVGSAVYRRLAEVVHGLPVQVLHDYDFVVEQLKPAVDLPGEWQQTTTNAGELRLVNSATGLQIDCLRLDMIVAQSDRSQVSQMTTEQKIQSYFSKVPLTIQVITYDLKAQKLNGQIGINAVINQEIKLNALTDEFKSYCDRRSMSIDDCLQRKADNLNFKLIK